MTRIFYRIHTEDRDNLSLLVTEFFECFAVWRGIGYWRGVAEAAACIDIIGSTDDEAQVERLARVIRETNQQEAVYVTASPCTLMDVR